MDDEASFLAAIHAAPHDPAPRLVYADWLEERGDPRAELLRVQCELVRTWSYADERPDLGKRLQELRKQFDPDWVAEVRSCTTPPPRIDFLSEAPEFAALGKPAVRLHPRQGKAPQDASKMGGLFLWPKDEPWPRCERDDIPCTPVLQIRKEDVPEIGFPEGTDLMQLLWCAMGHEEVNFAYESRIVWRRRADVIGPIRSFPKITGESEDWSPNLIPCRLYPERVMDYPGYLLGLPKILPGRMRDDPRYEAFSALWDRLSASPTLIQQMHSYLDSTEGGIVDRNVANPNDYRDDIGEVYGTKVGGFGIDRGAIPTFLNCECGGEMDLLFQIDSREYLELEDRWTAIEDRFVARKLSAREMSPASRGLVRGSISQPSGFSIHDEGTMHVCICRRCPTLPVKVWSSYN